ncbi:acetyl-CoA carboxylase biotin carboxyl carrier protein subunit, partial [Cupriavidus sp. 2MCAB6]
EWVVAMSGASQMAYAVCDTQGLLLRLGGFEGRIEIAFAIEAAAARRDAGGDSGSTVRAPMPGTLAALHVAAGDTVEAGQIVAVLESMKLFMELKSPAGGTVQRIGPRAGSTVAAGDILVAIEPV